MWRAFLVLMIALFTIVALAQSSDDPTIHEPLRVWTWQPSGPDLAEDYQIAQPDVQISVRRFASGAELYQALLVALQGGGDIAPDVVRLEYAFIPLLESRNALLSLETLLSADAPFERTKALFPAWTWKAVSGASGVYGVPVDVSPAVMVYREDLLSPYKLNLPTTWAQLVAASEQVFKLSKGRAKFFNFDPSSSVWWLALAQGSGSRVWSRTSTPAEAYTQQLADAPASRLANILEPLVLGGKFTTFASGSLEQQRAFRDGTLISSVLPLSGVVSLARVLRAPGAAKYRIAMPPALVAGRGIAADWGGSGCAVTVRAQQPEAAARYCLWLATNASAQRKSWERDGLLPAALNAPLEANAAPGLNSFYGSSNLALSLKKLAQGVQSQSWVPWLPLTDAVYRQLMRSVVKGDLTLSDALGRWQATVLLEARKAGFTVK
jgi:multiple sugar transport system substrate-binding protein